MYKMICVYIPVIFVPCPPPYLVFKNDRGQSEAAKKEKAKEEEKTQQPAYIPVVGESEPELKPVGQADSHKRKIEHTQLATDDYHYDKYRKRTRRF